MGTWHQYPLSEPPFSKVIIPRIPCWPHRPTSKACSSLDWHQTCLPLNHIDLSQTLSFAQKAKKWLKDLFLSLDLLMGDTKLLPNKSKFKTSFTLFFVKSWFGQLDYRLHLFCNCGHYQDSSASFLEEDRGGRGEGEGRTEFQSACSSSSPWLVQFFPLVVFALIRPKKWVIFLGYFFFVRGLFCTQCFSWGGQS